MKKVNIYLPPQQGDDFPTAGEFKCRFPEEMAIEWPDWTVKWKVYEVKDYLAEIDICAGGNSYWLIISRYVSGYCLSVPEWYVGCPLSSSLTDVFWNYDRIANCLKAFDSWSIAKGIADFSRKTGWGAS